MPRVSKKDAPAAAAEVTLPVATDLTPEPKDKKPRKPRATKRVVTVSPGEELTIKVDHNVLVKF